jgi:hypothetical protein
MDLSAALELLAHTSEDDIERCCLVIDVSLLQQTIEKLQRVFCKLPSRRNDQPSQLLQPSTELAKALSNSAKQVKELLSHDYKGFVGRPLAETTNYRLLDIRVVDRSKKTPQELLRRVLALRSLASEFIQWNPARFEAIKDKKSFDLPSNKRGSIRSFVIEKLPHDKYGSIARKAIKNGLVILAMEAAFPDLNSGLAAVLGIAGECVGKALYSDLVTELSSPTLPEVGAVAAESISWMDNAQAFYDGQADAQSTVSDPAALSRTLPPSDQSITPQKHHTDCQPSRKRRKIMPKGSASNRRSTSQTQANSLPLLVTPTHCFQKEPNTTYLYLEPGGVEGQQAGSGAAQDSRGVYLGGRELESDTDRSGDSSNHWRENGGRTTATRHSPISPRGSAVESLPTHNFQADLNSTEEGMPYLENENAIVGVTAFEDEHCVPHSILDAVPHGQKRRTPNKGEAHGGESFGSNFVTSQGLE